MIDPDGSISATSLSLIRSTNSSSRRSRPASGQRNQVLGPSAPRHFAPPAGLSVARSGGTGSARPPVQRAGHFLGPRPGGVTDFKFSTCTGRSYFNCIPHPNHPICFQRIPRSSAFGHTSPSASFLGLSTRSASRPYFLQLSHAHSSPTRSSFREGCGAAAPRFSNILSNMLLCRAFRSAASIGHLLQP